MRGRGFSFHGPVNLGEAGGHRSKLKVVLAFSLFSVILTKVKRIQDLSTANNAHS